MKPDRFLTGILIGIGVLIVLALALFFVQRERVDYMAEDTPAGVVHNYVRAIEQQDYERAYSYLADTETKPSYSAFRITLTQDFAGNRATAAVEDAEVFDNEAIVGLIIVRPGYGLFAQPYQERQTVLLVRQNEAWKITRAPWPYWGWDWSPVK
jgi:hypothetical protein